jgi:hypothetical protein
MVVVRGEQIPHATATEDCSRSSPYARSSDILRTSDGGQVIRLGEQSDSVCFAAKVTGDILGMRSEHFVGSFRLLSGTQTRG